MSAPTRESAATPVRGVPRVYDGVALLLIAGGVGLFLYARAAMASVADGAVRLSDGAGANVAHVARLERLSHVGIGVVAAGVALSIAVFAWFRRRRQPSISP